MKYYETADVIFTLEGNQPFAREVGRKSVLTKNLQVKYKT